MTLFGSINSGGGYAIVIQYCEKYRTLKNLLGYFLPGRAILKTGVKVFYCYQLKLFLSA